jgi:sRNA-binding regulator protein Hfq
MTKDEFENLVASKAKTVQILLPDGTHMTSRILSFASMMSLYESIIRGSDNEMHNRALQIFSDGTGVVK